MLWPLVFQAPERRIKPSLRRSAARRGIIERGITAGLVAVAMAAGEIIQWASKQAVLLRAFYPKL
jgi:hypothetical protein